MKAIDWMKLPQETKAELIAKYDLKRSGYTDVRGNVVISDGFTDNDLKEVELNKETQNETNETEQNEGAVVSGNGNEKEGRKAKGTRKR